MRNFVLAIYCTALTITFLGFATPLTANETAQINRNADRFFGLIRDLRNKIDRSQFDIDALLESLDFDADKIVAFATEEIRFEPYSGLLRGPRGTLMARAGNALDQSLLLGSLLKDAGYEARIVRTTLDERIAAELISQMNIGRIPKREIGSEQHINDSVTRLEKLFQFNGVISSEVLAASKGNEEAEVEVERQISKHAEQILNSLEKSGLVLADRASLDEVIQETTDYFWVQYRSGPASQWVSVHPATSLAQDLQNLSIEETYADTLPDSLLHKIRIEAFVTRRTGETDEDIPIMSPWERPSFELIGESVTYTNFPTGLISAPDWTERQYAEQHSNPHDQAYDDALRISPMIAPKLNGQLAPSGKLYDLLGNVVPASEGGTFLAPLFQTLSVQTSMAVSALADISSSDPDAGGPQMHRRLTKQWVLITIVRPGQENKSFRRTLFEVPKNQLALFRNVGQQVTFSFGTGSIPDSYLVDAFLDDVLSLEPAIRLLSQDSPSQGEDDSAILLDSPDPVRTRDQFFFVLADNVSQYLPDALSYRPEPTVIGRYRNVWLHDEEFAGFDIVTNARRSFMRTQDDAVVLSREATVFAGVWETLAESLIWPGGRADPANTIDFIENELEEQSTQIFAVLNPSSDSKASRKLGPVSEFIQADLDAGYWIVAPTKAESNTPPKVWWRVDPRTGETLGMIEIGWGGKLTEYGITVMNQLRTMYGRRATGAAFACNLLAGSGGIVAALGTSNIPFETVVSDYTAKVIPVVGYGVAALLQSQMLAMSAESYTSFMIRCTQLLIRI